MMTSPSSSAESSAQSPPITTDDSSSLDGLIKDFMKGMRETDWLKENTADKWELENPGLALEYRSAIKKTSNHGDGGDVVVESGVKETAENKTLESLMLKAKKDIENSGLLNDEKTKQ
jgi:hypothetical protein